jgi:hypothetical protein
LKKTLKPLKYYHFPSEIDKTSDEAIFMELEINKVSALTEIFRTIATEMDVIFWTYQKQLRPLQLIPFILMKMDIKS